MPDPLRPRDGSLEPSPRLDTLLPPEMATRAEEIGIKKAPFMAGSNGGGAFLIHRGDRAALSARRSLI